MRNIKDKTSKKANVFILLFCSKFAEKEVKKSCIPFLVCYCLRFKFIRVYVSKYYVVKCFNVTRRWCGVCEKKNAVLCQLKKNN